MLQVKRLAGYSYGLTLFDFLENGYGAQNITCIEKYKQNSCICRFCPLKPHMK